MRKNFFYIHKNIVTKKLGEKKRETIFPETQQIVRAKNVRKKSSQKIAKKGFLYSHEYRDQKLGEKTRETIFPETNH